MKKKFRKCKTAFVLTLLIVFFISLLPSNFSANAAGSENHNAALGKSYVPSIPASPNYPDTLGKKLTDGKHGTTNTGDPAWQGRNLFGSYTIVLDLEQAVSISSMNASFLQRSIDGVVLPNKIRFYTSDDNVNFTEVGEITASEVTKLEVNPYDNQIYTAQYEWIPSTNLKAAYVKVEIESTAWSFIDEIEVWGEAASTTQPAGHPVFKGTFLQPALADSWSDVQWNQEFNDMKNVGIDQLFMQWVADSQQHTAIYPTQIAGFTQNTSKDVLAKTLQHAEVNDIEVYVGLILNEDWFIHYANDQAWLDNEAAVVKDFIEEIWSTYGSSSAFAGWYLSFEVDNWNLPTSTEWDRLANYYADVISKIKGYTPNKPVVISPFFNPDGGLDTAGWKTMWEYILDIAPIDIIALQDGVGAGHAALEDLPSWFAATKQAIDAARPTTQLWSDTETFTLDFMPMNIQPMVNHMKAVQPYVEQYVSFSFNHYLSPQQVNPLFYSTYQHYVETGEVDQIPPSKPLQLSANAEDALSISLQWHPAQDNIGVVGYRIFRDNEQVLTIYSNESNETSYKDTSLQPGTTYHYYIQAFDAAGNYSAHSDTVAATTLAGTHYPHNFALNKPYTSSYPAHVNYPDNGAKLTDGQYGGTLYTDTAWQARHTEQEFEFVIDLGQQEAIHEIKANFLQSKSLYIFLPKKVTYYVSGDGNSFSEVGSVNRPAVGDADMAKSYVLTDLSNVSVRYIKVKVTPATAWTFIDEVEARGYEN